MMTANPHNAYQQAQKRANGPRDAEFAAFSEATRRLIAAADAGDDRQAVNEALHANRLLWGALADDCARSENALPVETRAQIISLSRWVAAHSRDVLRGKEPLGPLIDINRMMMEGLSGKAPQI